MNYITEMKKNLKRCGACNKTFKTAIELHEHLKKCVVANIAVKFMEKEE